MREIKFRGLHNKKWYYGSLVISNGNTRIFGEWKKGKGHLVTEVDPKTVGQYTGKNDKKSNNIYEDDLVKYMDYEKPLIVGWCNDGCCQFRARLKGFANTEKLSEEMEVIGTIYENKNLLK